MKRSTAILLAGVALPCLAAPAAMAQTVQANPGDVGPIGKQSGIFMIRLRVIGVLPENPSSSVSAIGGHVHASDQAAPELDLSCFFTDHIAASTRHEVWAGDTAPGKVDVGSIWVLPPTVTLQYHFRPHARLNPYVGAGLTLSFFYDGSPA